MSNKTLAIGILVILVGLFAFSRINNNQQSNFGLSVQTAQHGATMSGQSSDQTSQTNFAPDFSLESIDGGNITLSQYRGEKPVILDFFATWCPNCQRDMPRLSRWYDEKYKDKVEVIGINLRENKGKVKDFTESYGISFPIVFDPRGQVAQVYGIRFTNTHYLINKEGVLVREIPGDIKESDIKSLLQ